MLKPCLAIFTIGIGIQDAPSHREVVSTADMPVWTPDGGHRLLLYLLTSNIALYTG